MITKKNKKDRLLGDPVPDGTVRIKKYSIDLIFDFIKNNPNEAYYIDEDGNKCKLRRAAIYFSMGFNCVEPGCKLKGDFFALEKWPKGDMHFDLYSIDENGREVLMTIDHIHPKSKGGEDHIENYQPMCCVHNYVKADKVPS